MAILASFAVNLLLTHRGPMKKFVLVLLALAACAPKPKEDVIHSDNYVLNEYVRRFNDEAEKRGVKLKYTVSIQLVSESELFEGTRVEGIIGLCLPASRLILLNRTYWINNDRIDNHKERLVFHELGHCELNRRHDERMLSNGIPYSIMFPVTDAMPDNYYLRHRVEYLNRLFGRELLTKK